MGRVSLISFQGCGPVDLRAWVDAAQGLALLRRRWGEVAACLVRTPTQGEQALAGVHRDPPSLLLLHADLCVGDSLLASFLDGLAGIPATTAVVVAGALPSFQPDRWGLHPKVDGIIAGGWMEPATRVAAAVVERGSADGVPGVLWHRQGSLYGDVPFDEDPPLRHWPAPHGFVLRATEIAQLHGHHLPIRAGRGFPFRGLFTPDVWLRHLSNDSSYHHLRPVELVVGEAMRLRDEYGLRGFRFVDEVFPWDDDWLKEFITRWPREVQRPFSIHSCAEHLTGPRLALLHRAGLRKVTLSLEAADECVRSFHSNLNASNLAVGEVVDLCREEGIETAIELLLAAPGETPASLDAADALLDSVRPSAFHPMVFAPVPATEGWGRYVLPLCDKPPLSLPDPPAEDLLAEARARLAPLARKALAIRGKRLLSPADGATPCFRMLAALADLQVRSPWKEEPPVEVEYYHSSAESHPALGLRVPCQVIQVVDLPAGAIIRFGIMIKANLPGERIHRPVSFVIKVEQKGRYTKLFHKVLVQALDPDSRRWHWFALPITGVKPGLARLRIESFLTDAREKNELPPGGAIIMAGWAGLEIEPRGGLPVTANESHDEPGAMHLPLRVVSAESEKLLNPDALTARTWADFELTTTPSPDKP